MTNGQVTIDQLTAEWTRRTLAELAEIESTADRAARLSGSTAEKERLYNIARAARGGASFVAVIFAGKKKGVAPAPLLSHCAGLRCRGGLVCMCGCVGCRGVARL